MLSAVMAGCGAMSEGWLRALSQVPRAAERLELAGFVDLDPGRARQLAQAAGAPGAATGTDLAAMLEAVRPDIVFDVVIPGARRTVAETALARGCHVLSEKPMAESLADAAALIEAARRAGRIHAVVQNRRFVPGIRRLRRLIEERRIGRLTGVHCDFFVGAHFGGFREQMDHVLLLDMSIHTLDAARYLIGAAPQAVYCHETNPTGSWYSHGAAASAIFEFPENVTFTYRGSWCAEGANTSWEGAWRVTGTEGTATWDGAEDLRLGRVTGTEGLLRAVSAAEVPEPPDPGRTLGHASVIDEFLSAIETGRAPETAAEDNIRSLAMVLAAIDSAERRARVTIDV
ncbi:Gfo/Idh/MocA family protein [Mangrovicoccus sp. HB161399]|uniref:Gfo/Idh/MocA family protein n=1 Tax=Mangrovicoccus sp. HB161399 TaxID=2720392 RepID=UPI001552515F|nr:Gfo/Idh/MocA family oxidoreductase [Mangrovicoccus sp. HB161399]